MKKFQHLLQKKVFNKIIFILFVVFATTIGSALAQNRVTGKVVDKNGESLPGVTVSVQGTTTGSITDINGEFTLNASSDATLLVSYVGFEPQVIPLNGRSRVDVTLNEDTVQLAEVVIVGYGSVEKNDLTGSVTSIKADDINAFPVLDAAQALQGRAAGVVVQSNNGGEPGAPINIQIRGNTSIRASSNPLIVVDGFIGATFPQQADIESIEILKDASAAAIYGSRGSNGVVLVTTKKGKAGKVILELNSNVGISNTANELDLLNADQFAAYQQQINPSYVQGPDDTDWQDVIFGTGTIHNHQLSVSGGSENINFYASTNYFQQDGVILNSGFERVSFLTNVDGQVNDKVKVGVNLFASRDTQDGVPTQSTGQTANGGGDDVVGLINRFTPDRGIFNADGTFTVSSTGDDVDNPYAVATQRQQETQIDRLRGNLYLDYDIIENLSFRTSVGFSTLNQNVRAFIPSTLTITDGGIGGRASISNLQTSNLLNENYLTYNKEIGKGNLTILGGYSYQKQTASSFSAGASGLLSDEISFGNLGAADNFNIPTSGFVESELISQFGRFNFDYDDKYLITATFRRDGSSNFSENEKWAFFPSAAVGWRISNESFLSNHPLISNLKLRASYGVTGNQAIPAFSSFASVTSVQGLSNGQVVTGIAPNQAANPNLKWESSFQTNIGVDLGLFKDRLSLALNYYNINTEDILVNDNTQPQFLGFQNTNTLVNNGEINNKGFEISLTSTNINKGDFQWSTSFNLARNRAEVISLNNDVDVFLDASPSFFSRGDTHLLREGETPGAFFGFEYVGVFQGGDTPEGTATMENGVAGDPLFSDLDGDGEITTDDRTIIGDPTPDFTFGINNSISYKNFDFNVFFQGSQGGEIFNLTRVQLFNGDGNATTEILDAWTPENTNTNIPRVGNNSSRELSSRFVESGSFVRLKNLAIGYNVPSDIVSKFGLQSARFSISAQNLLTFSGYSGLDPEVSFQSNGDGGNVNSNTTAGFDYGNYPSIRTYTFSVNLKF